MIDLTRGNILQADAEALVNTVNCVGVMGKGIALQFKNAFPDNFKAYERACRNDEVRLGQMFIVPTNRMVNPKYIINFPTKQHWKGKSDLKDIKVGLEALVHEFQRLGITSIAIPPLGCGNGGLEWSEVAPLIRAAFGNVPDAHVLLFEPQGAPVAEAMPIATNKPQLTRARALMIRLIEQYAIPGYRLSLLEVQKLAYFLQHAGERLRLKFVRHKYGPYADNLNHLLQRMEGHYIRGYGDRSRQPEIFLLPNAAELANAYLVHDSEASAHLQRVSHLIAGFESPYGMELLATVHWVVQEDPGIGSDIEALSTKVHTWSSRKQQLFRVDHIRKAWRRLHDQSWLKETSLKSRQ